MNTRNRWLDSVPEVVEFIPDRRAILQTYYPKTFAFSPVSAYFYLTGNNEEFCSEHTDCMRVTSSPILTSGTLLARLSTPINIQSTMPGSGHLLTNISLPAQYNIGWGTSYNHDRHIKIDDNGSTDIFKVDGDRIVFGNGSFFTNQYGTSEDPLNIDLSLYPVINVEIKDHISAWTGWFRSHLRSPLITIMYIPSVPPVPATVVIRVTNRSTGASIKNAFVQILAGNSSVGEGYTDSNGTLTLENIPGGITGISYTIDISANGYHGFTESIEVVPGTNSFSYTLTPIPVTPIPDWVWWVIGITTAVGGAAAGISYLRSRSKPQQERERFIVIK